MKLILVLNHTSLFEFIYAGVIPTNFLWQLARNLIFPVASETYAKKGIGTILWLFGPKAIPISRKRDASWHLFLQQIGKEDIVIYFPEGRMKRLNGLDKNGEPMTVRGGTLEVLERFRDEQMLIIYSDGLHHVFPPDGKFPKLFERISAQAEKISVTQYLDHLKDLQNISSEKNELKWLVAKDLEKRRDHYCSHSSSHQFSANSED